MLCAEEITSCKPSVLLGDSCYDHRNSFVTPWHPSATGWQEIPIFLQSDGGPWITCVGDCPGTTRSRRRNITSIASTPLFPCPCTNQTTRTPTNVPTPGWP